jgi:Mg2+-importing ATPase
LRDHVPAFRTGWFLESLISATLVVFAIRTRLPLGQSQPSRAMILATTAVVAVTVLLPYTPLAGALGFVPPGWLTLVFVVGISLLYLASVERTKRWFYHRYAPDKG